MRSLVRVFVAGPNYKLSVIFRRRCAFAQSRQSLCCWPYYKILLFPGDDAIPTGGGVSFNVDFKPVKKSKRRRKIKQRAQTPMVPKVEEKEDVRIFFPLL